MSKKDGTLDDMLLKILACPICRVGVEKINENLLKCKKCGKEFKVEGGVPNMLVNLNKKGE